MIPNPLRRDGRPAAAVSAALFLTFGTALWAGAQGGLASPPSSVASDILFVTQPPLAGDYGSVNSVFGNHRTLTTLAPRGGDLYIRYADGTLRNLTKEAGFGVNPFEQIAVREPTVHWSGSRALFSMVVGGTQKDNFLPVYWQIYEARGIEKGQTLTITKLKQPANVNNVAPLYATTGRILFVSDRTRTGIPSYLPQLDEYESVATTTGVWSMDPDGRDVKLLDNAPSGAFTPILASDGRIVFSRWDHLQRDQQNVSQFGNFGAFNYASESSDVKLASSAEIFPEPIIPIPTGQEVSFSMSVFFPWQMNDDGTNVETLNHLGRHELLQFVPTAKVYLPSYSQPGVNHIKQTFLHIKESPGVPGRFFGTNAPEFSTHSAGQIVYLDAADGVNAEDVALTYVTDPLSATAVKAGQAPPPGHPGLFRNALPLTDGSIVAVHSNSPWVETPTGPGVFDSAYNFHLTKLVKSGNYHAPTGRLIQSGIVKNVTYWDNHLYKQVSYTGPLWELDPVEVAVRPKPKRHATPLPEIEEKVLREVLGAPGVSQLRKYLRSHKLALLTSRNVTVRADLQQDVNLRVPGGVTTAYPGSTPYDVSFVQFLQGDLLRGYQYFNQGRRVLAVPMHDGVLPVVPGAPKGAARIALDGSVAAFVPAERALSWQLTAPDGKPVVRERYWVTFAAGEMRSCTNCHGVNKTDVVLGQGPPANSPKALRELAGWYKDVTGNGLVGDTIGIYKASVNWMAMRNDNSSGPADVSFNPTSYQAGWIPFSGDWNGDGIDTVGFYDPATATFRLHDVNGPGPATLTFVFGTPGTASIPIAGDWDNDGVDTVGLFEVAAGYFRLRNFNASGMADVKFPFGPPGGVPVAGDWDADGRDSIGVYDPGTGQWFLRNANAPGPADVVVPFPAPGVKSWPLAGDWNNDGITSLGFYEDPSGTFYLRSTNGVSASVKQFTFGPTPEAFPLAGNWNGG